MAADDCATHSSRGSSAIGNASDAASCTNLATANAGTVTGAACDASTADAHTPNSSASADSCTSSKNGIEGRDLPAADHWTECSLRDRRPAYSALCAQALDDLQSAIHNNDPKRNFGAPPYQDLNTLVEASECPERLLGLCRE